MNSERRNAQHRRENDIVLLDRVDNLAKTCEEITAELKLLVAWKHQNERDTSERTARMELQIARLVADAESEKGTRARVSTEVLSKISAVSADMSAMLYGKDNYPGIVIKQDRTERLLEDIERNLAKLVSETEEKAAEAAEHALRLDRLEKAQEHTIFWRKWILTILGGLVVAVVEQYMRGR